MATPDQQQVVKRKDKAKKKTLKGKVANLLSLSTLHPITAFKF